MTFLIHIDMLSIMHAYYTIFRVKSEEKSSIFSGGTPLAFSDGSTKVYLIYNQNQFTCNTTLIHTHSKTFFDFAKRRTAFGEHKSKITYGEEDWEEKPTE